MSFQHTDRAMKQSRARCGARNVLWALAHRANKTTGESWPSLALLAKDANLSVRQVQRALGMLVDLGEVEVLDSGVGRGNTPCYRVLVGRGIDAEKATEVTLKGDRSDSPHTYTGTRKNNKAARERARIDWSRYPESDDAEREPSRQVERWLVSELSKHFGVKVMAKHLHNCERFFVWRKIKQYVDDGERGATLKELMPRAQAEYQAELDQIQPEPETTDPEHDEQMREVYRKIKDEQDATAKAEYEAWEREHYPEVANA